MVEENRMPVITAVGLEKIFWGFWNFSGLINSIKLFVNLRQKTVDYWSRPKAKAVNVVDFEAYEGEVLGLLGPNGSGKSTIVKMLLGLLYPSAGIIKILNHSPRDVAVKKRIGYLPEETYLYKYLTAYETLDFFGALFNLSVAERKHRIEQLLDMVGMTHARNRPVGEFSKGMQRRIGLAQAMINDPDLLILDEPTSGLDPLGCREVKDVIRLMKERGKTVLITSHLLSDVEDVCDRVVILYGGKIRATGTLNELLTIPEESRIVTPLLKPEITEKVIEILRENLKGEDFSIDHPRKTLEEFFLDVIKKAQEESVATDGVVSSGKIAGYLKGKEESKSVLEDLVGKPEEEVKPKEEEKPKEEQKPAVDIKKITELTEEKEPEKPKEKVEEKKNEEKKKDLSDVSKKLQNLLSNDEDK